MKIFQPEDDATGGESRKPGSPSSVGTIVAGGSTPTSTTFSVAGTHVYARAGSYTIRTTFTDAAHDTATATTTASVAGAPPGSGAGVPVLGGIAHELVNVPVATFVAGNPLARATDLAAVINWGDGTASRGTVTAIGAANDGVLFSVSGTHAYLSSSAPGAPFAITTKVAEAANPASPLTIPSTATIAPSALNVSVVPVIAVARHPASLPADTIVATFTDSRGTYAPDRSTATVVWGDGWVTNSATIVPLGGGSYAVLAGHTYALKGAYVIKVGVHEVDSTTQSTTTGFGANLATVNPRGKARHGRVKEQGRPALHLHQASHGGARHHE